MKLYFGTKMVIMTSFLAATSSLGGEFLRLKTGNVKIQNSSDQFLSEGFSDTGENQSGKEKYFVIQFKQAIPSDTREKLQSLGIKVLRYLPDDAYIVRSDSQSVGLVKSNMENIRAVSSFQPEWKVSPEFQQDSNSEKVSRSKIERILVSAFDETSSKRIEHELSITTGSRIIRTGRHDILIETNTTRLSEIANLEGVEWIQKMPIYSTLDFVVESADTTTAPPTGYQYTGHESGLKLIGFDAAWNRGYSGEGQVVAVADTGLDSGKASTIHSDFVGSLINGYSIGLGGSTWEDTMGHGTHVCGSVMGTGVASEGRIKGGAYSSKLVILGLWSDLLDNLAPGTDFEKIIGTAYPDGARIHTNSWGSAANPGAYDTMASRVDEYMWKHPDVLVLFAAGNSGEDLNKDGRIDEKSIGSPATAKNVLTVGASENELAVGGIQKSLHELRDGEKKWGVEPLRSDHLSDKGDGIAAFSSRGPTSDGRLKPEIVAPGTNIISTRSHSPKASKLWGEFNADYVYAGGTSMSTPITAGAAAVAREYLVKNRRLSTPSAALIKATLIHTAKDLYPGQYGTGPQQELPTSRPNVHEGYGRVDMDSLTGLSNETIIIDNKTGVGTAEENSTTVTLKDGQSLKVTLTYTDAPASSSAAKALVNDLDVKVISPSGEIRQLSDRINNTEMLELHQLASGEYRVVISGINVPTGNMGKQPYALLISQN